MPAPLSEAALEDLKLLWTDQYVRVQPGIAELDRFAERVGRVVTVNCSGKALVDFADGAWYDILASDSHLRIIDAAEGQAAYKATVNSAQPFPGRQG